MVNDFYTHLIGADRPIGQYLSRTLADENLPHKTVGFAGRERPFLQVQSSARPVYLLVPSLYHNADYEDALFWINMAKEEGATIFLVSSISICDSPSNEVVHEDWKVMAQDELSQLYLALEEKVKENAQHVILRTGQVFSFDRDDFSGQLLNAIRNEAEISLDIQRMFEPTPADDVATVVMAMLRQVHCSNELWGTYHFSGVESLSSYAFAEAILAEAGQYEDLSGVALLAQENRLQPSLWVPVSEHNKLFHTFGIKPKPWRMGLSRLVRQIYRAEA